MNKNTNENYKHIKFSLQRMYIIKSLYNIFKDNNKLMIAFNDDVLLEGIIYQIDKQYSLLESVKLRFSKFSILRFLYPFIQKNYYFFKIFYKIFWGILSEKPAVYFPFYITNNKSLLLSRTSVHMNTFKEILNEKIQQKIEIKISLRNRLGILISVLKNIFNFRILVSKINSIHNPQLRKVLLKNWLLISLVFFIKLIEYTTLYCYLSKIIIKNKPKRLICFEHGYIGAVVYDICIKNKIESVFFQHGILSNLTIPIPFNKNYLLTPYDKEYYNYIIGNNVESECMYSKEMFLKPKNNNKLKIALWALQYQTIGQSEAFMKEQIITSVKLLSKYGWLTILRPHPRDLSNWYSELISNNNLVIIDQYKNVTLPESIIKNNISLFFTFSSTSIFQSLFSGVLPVVIFSEFWKKLYFDFTVYCYPVFNTNSLKRVASMTRKEISNEYLKIKKKILEQYTRK